MGEIIVAYAHADEGNAERVIKKLESLGFTVRRDKAGAKRARRAPAAASAPPRLVLWSRNYASARSPGAARMRSALLAARLDTAPLPAMLKSEVVDLRAWRGRDDHRGWKALAAKLGAATGASGARSAPIGAAKKAKPGEKTRPAAKASNTPPNKAIAKKSGVGRALLWFAGAAVAAAGGAAVIMTMH